ncbi:lipase family alpha/beta hydrolase [Nocardia jiangxiensis]|uniref:lipase family alpha/beta hydrolase n=1 Tax=Nocardia jiangxiensis TaxID=282685 RepID=UPI00146CEA92|nr:alpha/beta fold hydrolase [Nocardia jiangxiensis]
MSIALTGVAAIVAAPAVAAPIGPSADPGIESPIRSNTSAIPAGTVIEPPVNCAPGPHRPHPVIVLPGADGTTDQTAAQWNPMLTALRADGGCAFVFQGGIIKGQRWAGDVPSEARQVADFVSKVRRATGADKVDIVAHSAGSFVAQYYLKVLHGASSVRDAVLLAPESRGCDGTGLLAQYGITNPPMTPVQAAEVAPYLVSALAIRFPGMAPAMQMSPTSEVYRAVFDGTVTQPGVHYSVLATRNDGIATPAVTCSLINEPGVVNVVYENRFPTAPAVDHSTLRSSPDTTAWVVEQLQS